jgi:hypothetical protein
VSSKTTGSVAARLALTGRVVAAHCAVRKPGFLAEGYVYSTTPGSRPMRPITCRTIRIAADAGAPACPRCDSRQPSRVKHETPCRPSYGVSSTSVCHPDV